MIAEAFYAYVSTNAAVAAVSSPSPLLYPHVMPQDHADPAMTYELDADDDQQLLSGSVSTLRRAVIDTSCWSVSVNTARTLAEALYGALVGYRGAFGDHTVDHIRLERKFELFETDTELYRVSQQFLIAYV